ncbi:MAG: hypothetical protein KatS3mg110_0598 [Pirellulaceae bacterium]|nr:MAG: hypothetical protein KatS3mg110_0598 [Pirellulaceae bacterium]
MKFDGNARYFARAAIVAALVLAAALSRLVPHPPNFTPVSGMALFGGAVLGHWSSAVGIPLAAMAVSDAVLGYFVYGYGFFHGTMPFVYGSLIAIVFLGRVVCRKWSVLRIGAAAVASSVLFFLVTNFGVWLRGAMSGGGLYPATWEGLAACYMAAIPFFGYTLAGDLFYTTLLFGAWALLGRKIAMARPVIEPVVRR